MTLDDLLRVHGVTSMTADDIKGFEGLSAPDAALLMQSYIDDGRAPSRGFWVDFGNGLKQVGEYAGVVGIICAGAALL